MSSVETAARVLKTLKDEEWRTLAALERISSRLGTADVGRLARQSHLPTDRIEFATGDLREKGLVARKGRGYSLTREGVEAMALKDYVKKDLIAALGPIIAKGKESDVYEAVTEEGQRLALKVYKIGRTSFTRVRKKRFVEKGDVRTWISANYEAARREYRALKKLQGLSASFPRVFASSRNTVLLEELSGVRLSQRPPLVDPGKACEGVLSAMRVAYSEGGLVNSDLSEYNILTNGESLWLIDWPQAVGAEHPNAKALLAHDVETVATFFRRAYGVKSDARGAMRHILGETPQLE